MAGYGLCNRVEEKLGWNNVATNVINYKMCKHKKKIYFNGKQLSLVQTAQWISGSTDI